MFFVDLYDKQEIGRSLILCCDKLVIKMPKWLQGLRMGVMHNQIRKVSNSFQFKN